MFRKSFEIHLYCFAQLAVGAAVVVKPVSVKTAQFAHIWQFNLQEVVVESWTV